MSSAIGKLTNPIMAARPDHNSRFVSKTEMNCTGEAEEVWVCEDERGIR